MNVYKITYQKNTVYQGIMVEATNEDMAKGFFDAYKPTARFIDIVKLASVDIEELKKRGMPLIMA